MKGAIILLAIFFIGCTEHTHMPLIITRVLSDTQSGTRAVVYHLQVNNNFGIDIFSTEQYHVGDTLK